MKTHYTGETKSERFDTRLKPYVKSILRKAADILGYSSLADFVISCAYKEASKIIKDNEIISLTANDQKVFFQSFINDALPTAAAVGAAHEYNNFLRKDSY